MDKTLERSILQTLCYFSQFGRPLTREELFRYLWRAPAASYEDFVKILAGGVDGVEAKDGLYFLAGEVESVTKHRSVLKISEKKLTLAKRAVKLIRFVPFLRAVFVCNTVAAGTATSESDIDVFIIAQKNHLWTVRFFTNLVLFIFGLRRHGDKITDRICLSFYVDTENVKLDHLKLPGDDIYLVYWVAQLWPLYDPVGYKKILLESNSWVGELLPNAFLAMNGSTGTPTQNFKKFLEFVLGGALGAALERALKKMQLKKIYRSSAGKQRALPTAVVVSDGVLKFHETDRREIFRERWLEKCQTVL